MVEGRALRFRLGGINNMNFLMYDEETGSWWQQISGECLFGPLKGRKLTRIPSDEVTLATWRAEHPESTAVGFLAGIKYPQSDWEKRIAKLPAVGGHGSRTDLQPRELVAGIEFNGASMAFPLESLRAQGPVNHFVGGEPVLVAAGQDGNSVRSFFRRQGGAVLVFYKAPDDASFAFLDEATGSRWDFSGRAVSGPLKGRQLERIQNTKDFWFDWQRYHPQTAVYRVGR